MIVVVKTIHQTCFAIIIEINIMFNYIGDYYLFVDLTSTVDYYRRVIHGFSILYQLPPGLAIPPLTIRCPGYSLFREPIAIL